jgi:DNA-binding response OmpR family regulator
MDSDYTVFIVDDDKTTRIFMEAMLGKMYPIESFDSSESCLERLEKNRPDLFLLDVGLPGLNGYELCRKIKSMPETTGIPVVFISGHDALEDALAGYDAGGEDYVVKPVEMVVLQRKIENLRRIRRDRAALSGQAKASDELATLVLANLDEYAVLIKFLRTLNECSDYRELVDAVLRVLGAFRLDGAVQVRLRNLEKTFSQAGENWPLEIAVIKHLRSLERIFEFQKRAAYNFDHITILVTNMPLEDPELCGRIRDNLAIAAESADAKLRALQSFADNAKLREEIHGVLQAVEQTIQAYGQQYNQARYKGSMHTTQMLDDLLAAFAHLGMSGLQEDEILGMVRDRSNQLIDFYDIAGETHATLETLGRKLGDILEATGQLKKN